MIMDRAFSLDESPIFPEQRGCASLLAEYG